MWKELWSNAGKEVADRSWKEVSYDIAEHADGQAAVRLRWGMGPTDESYRYCGWNIDDVVLWGVELGDGPAELRLDRLVYGHGARPKIALRDRGADLDAAQEEQLSGRDGVRESGKR